MDKVNALSAEKVSTPIAFFTLAGGEKAQAIVLIGMDGNPIASWPLPQGAATDAKQTEAVTALGQILSRLGQTLTVSAASLPLPAGAATDTKLEQVRALLAATLPVSAASLPLPNGAASQATLAQVLAALQATLGVHVDNLPADYPDSSANNKLTQVLALLSDTLLVSGPLTDEQLRDAPLANPVGAASAEKQDELKALATEIRELAAQNKALLDTLLMFSVAVLEKMPILTSADAANVQLMNPTVSLNGGQVGTVQNVSGGNLSLIPWQITPSHIYDNLHVTP